MVWTLLSYLSFPIFRPDLRWSHQLCATTPWPRRDGILSIWFLFCWSHFTVRGRPFHGNSPNIIQVPLVAKISSMVEGVCVCARLCAYVCMCVLLCVCMCVSVFVGGQENRSKLGSQWLREVTGAPRQPLLARCESARARRAAISLGLVTRKGKNSQRPRSQSCFAILASPRALPWGAGGSPASHSGTEGGLALSGCFRSRPSATARSQKGPTGFCALVRGWFA